MTAPRILLVEDDPATLCHLQRTLSDAGYEVMTAGNGVEALERADLARPDVVVTDLNMPEMDGVELCRRLKARHELRVIPIIVTSALPELPVALHGVAEAFFRKPVDRDELLDAIAFYTPEDE
jgi:CheY-like chemotaxis protein